LAGCFFCLAFLFGWLFHLLFCLNQDLQDIRDFQDGTLMCSGRFSGSGFFGWLVVWLVVFFVWLFCLACCFTFFLSEPGFTGY
jgi:hypothetical protein